MMQQGEIPRSHCILRKISRDQQENSRSINDREFSLFVQQHRCSAFQHG